MTIIEHSPDSSHETTFTGEPENTGEVHSRPQEVRIFWDAQDEAESRDEEQERPPVGKLLRDLRGDRSLRQVEADTGVSNSYLCNLESGVKRPGTRTLAKLAGYYQVPLVDLLQANGIQAVYDHIDHIVMSPEETQEVRRSYNFVLADPMFNELKKPASPTTTEYQQFIVKMYEVYSGKRLL